MKRRRWIWPLVALALAGAAVLYDRGRSRAPQVPPLLPPDQRAPLRFDGPASMSPPRPAPPAGAPAPALPGGGPVPPAEPKAPEAR